MRVLVSPTAPLAGADFRWTEPGELVIPGFPCDSPECGCDESFTGLRSRKGTTVAVVAEREVSMPELTATVEESTRRAGWDDPHLVSMAQAYLVECLDAARECEVGTEFRVRHQDGAVLLAHG